MHHLGFEHGFTTAVGSFQTGGPYSGPHHSMRWQNDHPIWWDAQFENMPGADANRGGVEAMVLLGTTMFQCFADLTFCRVILKN